MGIRWLVSLNADNLTSRMAGFEEAVNSVCIGVLHSQCFSLPVVQHSVAGVVGFSNPNSQDIFQIRLVLCLGNISLPVNIRCH